MLSSLAIILAHIIFLHLVRRAIRRTPLLPDNLKAIVLSGICAFELGCVSLEQGVLLEHYGYFVWAVSLVLVVTWQVVGWEGISPNALPYMLEKNSIGALRTLTMLACGLLSYRHMQAIWQTEVSGLHRGRAHTTSSQVCALPWAQLSLHKVLLCELAGSILLTYLPRYLLEHETLTNNDPSKVYRGLLVGVTVLIVVTFGMDTSGAMFNPTLATILIGGCAGYSWWQHLLIYWLTPVLGAIIAGYIPMAHGPKDIAQVEKKKIA